MFDTGQFVFEDEGIFNILVAEAQVRADLKEEQGEMGSTQLL